MLWNEEKQTNGGGDFFFLFLWEAETEEEKINKGGRGGEISTNEAAMRRRLN